MSRGHDGYGRKVHGTLHPCQVRVFDHVDRARSARAELISAGVRPQEVRILDAEAARLTRYLVGSPIPEAFAGLLVGAVLTTVLAVIPQIGPIFDRGGPLSYALIAMGALVGAIGSYVVARAHPPIVVERDLADGDYVVICDDRPVEQRAA
jgi:hypothetical protein